MDLVKDLEVEVARQARGVLSIDRAGRTNPPSLRSPRESPVLPRRAHEPGAVEQQTVAAAPVLPGAAEAVGDGARRDDECLAGGAIAHVPVETELVLERRFLERRVLPSEVEPGRHRPGQHRSAFRSPRHHRRDRSRGRQWRRNRRWRRAASIRAWAAGCCQPPARRQTAAPAANRATRTRSRDS